jgi:hypothetical protein
MSLRLSQLEFGALLTYAPRGNSHDTLQHSRNIRIALKSDSFVIDAQDQQILMSQWIAQTVHQFREALPFTSFFQDNTILVPTPKSSLMQPNTLWVPNRIANALVSRKLGKEVVSCLFRSIPVPKSSRSAPQQRPKPFQHFQTIGVQRNFSPPDEMLLVDDNVTRGSTLLGAANRLAVAFPNTHIRAFAAMRTISNPNEFENVFDPCIGTITLRPSGDTLRRP